MRKIKFRGCLKRLSALVDIKKVDFKLKAAWFVHNNMLFEESLDDVVLLQFTGFYDSSGKEIYEGDIVEHRDRRWEIEWDKRGQWVAELKYKDGVQKISPGFLANETGGIDSFAVVGNIFKEQQ